MPFIREKDNQPITRNRTLFFLSVRDTSTFGSRRQAGPSYGADVAEDDERGGLLREHRVDFSQGLPPKCDEVEDILNRVKGKVAALDKLHAKHVLPGFNDRSAEEREIEKATTEITRASGQSSNLIGTITPEAGTARVERLTAKNVQRGLAQKVQEASGQFRKKQRVYMQRHQIKNKDLLAASGAISLRGNEGLESLAEDEAAVQLQSTEYAPSVDIQQRTNEITQIATSITELADLFRDLSGLIVQQGTVLDSVEYNVQQTARQMDDAVEELKVAKRYQSNTGKRKCILLLILIIVGLILVLIYKPRRSGASAGGGGDTGVGEGGKVERPGNDGSIPQPTQGSAVGGIGGADMGIIDGPV
ncbi:t-SNARE [Trichosporon asahii var. asahii CBS 2479]|uniref:t-SNARE n=1 Tax=Trichosporon asahii var. asahii (strain ATCC 90039 / CBS 2479 / JCM 2466 / KCTC 7840 / NBRC 103889/ NCYC 2677 / UAMH 7654) TaxID=1186058 RepID=J6F6L3_TRIAS|nr:t-SNARE [Trichosporon asahii var. asahii CBS 2479]EJT50962.1 t-SNARE [Trichosporon asahii var. asahii CBS 2479]